MQERVFIHDCRTGPYLGLPNFCLGFPGQKSTHLCATCNKSTVCRMHPNYCTDDLCLQMGLIQPVYGYHWHCAHWGDPRCVGSLTPNCACAAALLICTCIVETSGMALA